MNVIGAGPTGSIAGIELLKKGYSPVLHDRFGKENYKYVRCSGIISDKAFNYYSKYIKFNVLNELKKLMVDFNSERLVIKPRKKAYVISRADLNRDLLDKYLSMGGDFIHENINSDDLFKMKGHIIGADGPSSAVAQTFNFPKFDNVFNTAQTFIDSKDFELDTARIFLNVKGVFGWLFPHGDKCELGLATI